MGTLLLLWVKFMGVVMVFRLMGPDLVASFTQAQKTKTLNENIVYLTITLVVMLILAAMAFGDPPAWMARA
tara:strand:- start:2821 stop:3033 length:213 start_codon:yes stop_codon:yes gene_type:complete